MANDQDRFADVPVAFQDVFRDLVQALQPRTPMTRGTVRIYHETLSRFSIDCLQESARDLRRSCTFFPSTGEWFQAATLVVVRRGVSGLVPCGRCGGKGVIRVMYRSGEPFDLAVCDCADGHFYRAVCRTSEEDPDRAAAFIRERWRCGPEHQVGYIEDFPDDDSTSDTRVSG